MSLTQPAPDTSASTSRRIPSASRRLGYLVAIVLNLTLAYLVNVWPSWHEVSWLTAQTQDVLGLVNLWLLVGAAVTMVYLVYDRPWFTALGDLVTTSIALAVVVEAYTVFPFDFSQTAVDWSAAVRVVLVIAITGTAIGTVVSFVTFIARAARTAVGAASAD
jgi:hypothetical protein